MTETYVTTATDDISCLGCLVLCNSLKQSGTEKKISVIVYPEVSRHLRKVLQDSFDCVFYTADLSLSINLEDLLNDECLKIKCWLLTQFTKCVFLESDVLVVENIDDLFERSEFSAVTDSKWPDCFDTGVFVYEPNRETYLALLNFLVTLQGEDNSLQNLLNSFFCNWSIINIDCKIPFIYNCQLNSSFYTHTNALVYFGRSIKAARLGHSISQMMQPNTLDESAYDNWNRLFFIWWKIFNEMVKPAVTFNQIQNFNRTNWVSEKLPPSDSSREPITDGGFIVSKGFVENSFENEISNEVNTKSEQDVPIAEEPETNTQTNEIIETIVVDSETNLFYSNENQSDSIIFEAPIESTTQIQIQNYEQVENQLEEDHLKQFSKDEPQNTSNIVENLEELENRHRQQWERGEIDYTGKDSFENILLKLNSSINQSQVNPSLNIEE